MRVKKPIILYLPTSYIETLKNQLEVMPPEWKYSIDYFYYVSFRILQIQSQQKKEKRENNEYVCVDLQEMKDETGSNIDRYINYLIKGELLERDFFIKGKKSYYYRINKKYNSGYCKIELSSSSNIYDKIVLKYDNTRKHYNRMPEFLKIMQKEFKGLELDYKKAEQWIFTQPADKQIYYLTALARIKDKRFRSFKRNKTNTRLDTNLTNLKSDLRQFIIGDYVSIDLKNSQPFFLSRLIIKLNDKEKTPVSLCCYFNNENLIKQFDIKQIKAVSKIPQNNTLFKNGELLKFGQSCVNGLFYDDFINSVKFNITRDEVKDMMFCVLFSKNSVFIDFKKSVPYEKEKKIFSNQFPVIAEIVKTLKQKKHNKLAIYLQRIEAFIFIDTICPLLVEKGIKPLTIHDSVIIEAKHKEAALRIIKKVFADTFGVVPTFHVTHLKPKETAR